jgi:hypothetical protein
MKRHPDTLALVLNFSTESVLNSFSAIGISHSHFSHLNFCKCNFNSFIDRFFAKFEMSSAYYPLSNYVIYILVSIIILLSNSVGSNRRNG